MAEPDAFDPTHALDGWRPPARAPLQSLDLGALLHDGSQPARLPVLGAEPGAFDPTHLLDGWRPPTPAPLDLELGSLARAGRSGPDEAKKARLKARGYEMHDVEDIELSEVPPPAPRPAVEVIEPAVAPPPEVPWPLFTAEAQVLDAGAPSLAESGPEAGRGSPAHPPELQQFFDDIKLPQVPPPPAVVEAPVLDLRVAPPPPTPDPQQVIADIELPEVQPVPAVAEAPVLDVHARAPRADPDPRLVAGWQPQAWTALTRRVADASTEVSQAPDGPQVDSHAPQWLCAIWPPQQADLPLGRWPELAALVAAETGAAALQQLLVELPGDDPLWFTELEADWGLVAELVLRQDTGLRPTQARALHALVAAERDAHLARLDAAYALQGHVARRRE